MSDIAGSSGGRGNAGRGSGVCAPFYEFFSVCNFGKINISDDNIVIDCETLVGKVHDETAIEKLYGENLEIGFTNQFLLDVFGSCDTEEVFVEFSTPLSPMVVTPLEGDKFFYIILPIRLKK